MATSGENAAAGQGVGLPVGSKIGKYEVVERSGIGGQAIVYKCYDRMLDRFVAAKQISPHLAEDPKFVERFRKEAQILAKLGAEGTSIVAIHDLLEDPAGLFIVMEFVQGHTLETILHDTNGPTEPKAALQILWRLAAALHVVHAAGIIHRDLKPGNIIIAEGLRPKITDFGVAASRTGQTSMLLGTTKYMAPELFVGGDVDGRADLYSLGMIAYELLLGRPKFNQAFDEIVRDPHSEALRWMKWHSNEEVTAPPLHTLDPNIPEGLSDIVVKMMAKKREDRYESMEALGRAIRTSFSPRGKAVGGAPAVGPAGTRPRPLRAAGAGASGGAAMAEAEGDDLEIHAPPATAPIPKKPMALRTKLVLAGAAFVVLMTGVIYLVIQSGNTARSQDAAARKIYLAADGNYNAGKYEDALVLFDSISPKYPGTSWAVKAGVMSPLTRSRIAERDANTPDEWEIVAREEKAAEDQAKSLLASTKDKAMETWLRDILTLIEDDVRTRGDLRAFRQAMLLARQAVADKRYVEAIRTLEQLPRSSLSAEQKKQADALRQEAGLANFNKTFADLLAKADQLANLTDPAKPMDYDGAKAAFDQATKLLQDSGTILPQADVEARNKDLSAKLDRLEKKRKYLDAVKRVATADTPKAKVQALMDQQAMEVALGMTNGNTQKGIAQAQADQMMQQAQVAFDAGKFPEARRLALDANRVVPNYAPAVTMIQRLDSGEKRKTLIAQGDQLFAQGKYAEALAKYLEASQLLADPDLTAKITNCQFELLLAEAERLKGLKQYDAAIKTLELARAKKPSEAPRIDAMEAGMKQVMEYDALAAEGDKAYAAADFPKARDAYNKAAKKLETAEIKQKVALANYQVYLKSGKESLAAKQGDVARAYFLQAKKYVEPAGIKPDEVDNFIRQAEALTEGAKP
jgi:serine/threonine-protein kinase